ncbi:MAG: hypothetical protein K0Q49_138 [Haloplasmataceae bacterium]|jgi:hypothetical protein|nr:hypothetical protein [Haloplasmataceae bacterium]
MVNNFKNEFAKGNIQAYFKEAIRAFTIDLVLLGLIWLLYFCLIYENGQYVLFTILFTVVYFLLAIFLHYGLAILEFIDMKKSDVIKQTVKINDFKIENSWSGWLGHSNVAKFYPKDKIVDRFKIYFLNDSNEKQFVRLIMSLEKRKIIYNTFLENDDSKSVEIYYLKRSKILLSFNLSDKKEYDKNIGIVLHQLNNKI